MQRKELIAMMDRRSVESFGHSQDIAVLADKYPYCATFQVLKAISLKEMDSLDFSSQLNRAAIAIQDRSKLYNYIVKDQLFKRIIESERESAAVETGDFPEGNEPYESDRNQEETTESEPNSLPEHNNEVLSTEPMEAEIMHAAIAHLGEMEATQKFQEFASSDSDPESQENNGSEVPPDENDSSEPMSFGKWLLQKDKKANDKKDISKTLINKFIQESPQISPVQTRFFSPSQMGKLSLVDDETFVTETLAGIYLRQGDYKKAARAYRNLGLNYPEKRTYFAALQKKAEDHLNN